MTLQQYFKHIQEKIQNKDFKILKIKSLPPENIHVYVEAINYMMWEWCDDHKDNRTHIFDYVIIPNDVDYDFTSLSFVDFINFLSSEKSKAMKSIDIKNIKIYEHKRNLQKTNW